MIIYFSGTGNSRYCAEYLGVLRDDEVVDAFKYMRSGIVPDFFTDEPYVFVSPTYCWQLPRIFQDFIRTAKLRGDRDTYFFMTCGSDIGNAEEHNMKLCQEVGLRYKGTVAIKMPENYIARYDAPPAEIAEKIVKIAQRPLIRAERLIHHIQPFPPRKVTWKDKFKSGPLNSLYYKFIVKAKPFYATDACIGCKKCEKACVLNNITVKDGKPSWGDKCTHCMACICGCPTEAIEYGKKSQGKLRYQCKKFEAETK